MMLTINAERLLAVHHWTSSGSSSLTITTSCHDFTMAYWWLQIGGEKDTPSRKAQDGCARNRWSYGSYPSLLPQGPGGA